MLFAQSIRMIYYSGLSAMMIYSGIITVAHMPIITGKNLPWQSCSLVNSTMPALHQLHNDSNCWPLNQEVAANYNWNVRVPPHLDYMNKTVYKVSLVSHPSFLIELFQMVYKTEDWSFVALDILSISFLFWVAIAVFAYFGVSRLGKAFVYMKFCLVLLVTINMIISQLPIVNCVTNLKLSGVSYQDKDASGLYYFFVPTDFTPLYRLEIWADAVTHVINSLR